MVITDMQGNVLACVSYPGYDSNRLSNNMDSNYFYRLSTDLSSPFYNRATQEVTAPGSTFKLVTATAGMTEGIVSPYYTISCTGVFEDDDPPINCWIYNDALGYGSHGAETLITAIQDSCNFYFNTVGLMLGQDSSGNYSDSSAIETLTKYAEMYGFDSTTGIEISETSPSIATSDAPRASMGQSNHAFTTSQLARYAATLANGGSCYDLTLLDRITDSGGNILEEKEPVLHSTVEMTDEQWNAIHTGMHQVITESQSEVFGDLNLHVAGKTGTAEESSDRANHGLFICYAPYDEPEIAMSVRITNGYSSRNAASVARDILSYYFALEDTSDILTGTATQVQEGATVRD